MIEALKELNKLIKDWTLLLKVILRIVVVYFVIMIVCILFRQEKVNQLVTLWKDYGIPLMIVVVLGKTNSILEKLLKKL